MSSESPSKSIELATTDGRNYQHNSKKYLNLLAESYGQYISKQPKSLQTGLAL